MGNFCCPALFLLIGMIVGIICVFALFLRPRRVPKGEVLARTEAQEAERHMVNPEERRVIVHTDEDEWAKEQNQD